VRATTLGRHTPVPLGTRRFLVSGKPPPAERQIVEQLFLLPRLSSELDRMHIAFFCCGFPWLSSFQRGALTPHGTYINPHIPHAGTLASRTCLSLPVRPFSCKRTCPSKQTQFVTGKQTHWSPAVPAAASLLSTEHVQSAGWPLQPTLRVHVIGL
jgi:hypothetical protein